MSKKKKRKTIFLTTLLVFMVLSTTLLVNWQQIQKKVFGSTSTAMADGQGAANQASGQNGVANTGQNGGSRGDGQTAGNQSNGQGNGQTTGNQTGGKSGIQDITGAEEKTRIDVGEYAMAYHPEGFAGADPAKQVGNDLYGFQRDLTFFNRELSKYEQALQDAQSNNLYFIITSVERDMRIQIQDSSGVMVTGVPFTVHVGDAGSYKDQDKDGIVYISSLAAGDYEVTLDEVEGYKVPSPTIIRVKDKVEYLPIDDIALLMKTEADIVAAEEDTEKKDALDDADASEIKDIQELGEAGQMGIDVSKYNGDIDWDRVRGAGIRYAIIRAGYRGSSTGALVEDPYYRKNMEGALAAGLKVGVYFFTQAVNEVEAVEEASMVLSLCEGYRGEYPIVIDTEGAGGNGRADGLDIMARTAVCRAFCETIEGAGFSSGVYASRNWLNRNLSLTQLEDYMTWLAEYRETPQYGGRYQFWQYTSSGSVDGIEGRVDLDISYLAY